MKRLALIPLALAQVMLARVTLGVVTLALVAFATPLAAQTPDRCAAGVIVAKDVAAGGIVRDLMVNGQQQRLVLLSPPAPRATLVMLPGGTGKIGIRCDGTFAHPANFLVRTRALWLARGYAVLIPDAPVDRTLRGRRSTPAYAQTVRALVAFARDHADRPVFLVGTSQGSIAAMNGAATLRQGEIAGVVLTESVSRLGASGETVFDAHPEAVTVPVLVVANADDGCFVAPPQDAPKIAAHLTTAPSAQVLNLSGGVLKSKPCGSLSPHGYYGIEDKAVAAIAAWIDAQLK
ncbi:alpha/beta hydrolase [Roseixanthobacter glucoisosaccharinicivorans]|uniref:alpha/beta hydrolase n=1 Tax=Roseixanthobacter glucoisosaccharinicivorans TaxID=3119923 RepID=UPI003729DB29